MSDRSDRERHRAELERSRRRWDFWSDHWGLVEQDTVGVRRETVEQLGLARGDTVLDLGCGPGVNLATLREAVGPGGRVLAVDLSSKMLERARARVEDGGWENVTLVRGDATLPVAGDERLDGVVATTAVSATPDVRSTVRNVHAALRPGGRFALYEIRPVPSGPARALNPLVRAFYRLFGNWNEEEDVLDELRATFDRTEVVRTFAVGTNYVAVAEKSTPSNG
jgi:demethylmenaquinone methyltransferase/2-methoxy-6-polyprenyl-1,4-benzoquinol methylase